MSGLAYLGPVVVAFHGDPVFSWASDPGAFGIRKASISGLLEWPMTHELSELVSNSDREITVGDHAGVLEYVYVEGVLLRPFVGWYLFETFSLDAAHEESVTKLAKFKLDAAYLGDREVVVVRSAEAKVNDVGITPASFVASPVRPEDPAGDRFVVPPGGSFGTRSFDPTSPHRPGMTPVAAPRAIGFYSGSFSGGRDHSRPVAVPRVESRRDAAPAWLVERGADVRVFDRHENREVYGAHRIEATTDVGLTNGIVRFWPGPEGLPPYLHVQAFAETTWHDYGYLHLADPTSRLEVTAARLVQATQEEATVALAVKGQGEILASLRRGERMIRVRHGSERAPFITARRVVRWAGLPPWLYAGSFAQGDGHFGLGVKTEDHVATWADPEATWADPVFTWTGEYLNPIFLLRWPPSVSKTDFVFSWWWTADEAAATGDPGGQMTIGDTEHTPALTVDFDDATLQWVLKVGATTLRSSVQDFAAGDPVFFGVRFSSTDGTTFAVKAGADALELVHSASIDTGAAGAYGEVAIGIPEGAWGDGAWDDGNWGQWSFPDGVIDDLKLFSGWVSDDELGELAAAPGPLENLPAARLEWYVPLRTRGLPEGSTMADGRRYETLAGVRADESGLTRALAVVFAGAAGDEGLSVMNVSENLDVGAYLATTDVLDDLVDHHRQFAAESDQETWLRD